jgi:very-short-patch-repair endonuclease
MIVVSSFAADEVDERGSDAEGFRLLRRFIMFASSGGTDFGDEGEQDQPLNPVEYDVLRRLRAAGLDVIPQYGVGGRRIDFAICHPDRPGSFVLAVEFDGASYHAAPVARERDRLRQQQLEARGWCFVRIWSTDYFSDPDAEIRRVVDAYKQCLSVGDDERSAAPEAVRPLWRPGTAQRAGMLAVPTGLHIDEYSDHDLDVTADWVMSDGLPRTSQELFNEVKEALGFQRNGRKIVERIEAAVRRCFERRHRAS